MPLQVYQGMRAVVQTCIIPIRNLLFQIWRSQIAARPLVSFDVTRQCRMPQKVKIMSKNLVANATISIGATRGKVWEALVTPAAIKQYMFGADVESDWHTGSEIKWKSEVKGKKYEDKGVILKFEPDQTLQYSHFSPLSGKPDRAENYHTVSIDLAGTGKETEVSLSQDNNADETSRNETANNWETMLEGLKKYVEKAS
jgi:uncharacterized protein YndB with AHSA1/START domain